MLTLLALLTTAATAQESYPNLIVNDLDGDGELDIAIGVPEPCGAVWIWLSSVDPDLGLPRSIDPDRETPLDPPTHRVDAPSCDPTFGATLHTLTSGDRIGVGTQPDDQGAPTTELWFDENGAITVVTTGRVPAGGSTSEACEPCCGPAPCCIDEEPDVLYDPEDDFKPPSSP